MGQLVSSQVQFWGIVDCGMIRTLSLSVPGPGLHDITREVRAAVQESGLQEGLCTVFVRHTSASLTIQENADPSARHDLERWLARLVPENDPLYTHTAEGPDDMPSHIRAALTATSLGIPILEADLALGTWQGIYLWEHRRGRQRRSVVLHLGA
jgi:secondary thiamine-phosphate synthase enzyme